MAGHTSEKRWSDVTIGKIKYTGISTLVSSAVSNLITNLNSIEEAYQQMQEIYIYAGGTATDLAEQLFKEDIAARSSPNNVASAEEIAKATDIVNAMTAAHQIFQAANNVVVTQSDRMTEMRRMA